MNNSVSELIRLANLYGINHKYTDMRQHLRHASDESLIAVLKALHAPISNESDIATALLTKQREDWNQILQPVIICWQNENLNLNLKIPARLIGSTIRTTLQNESGETSESTLVLDNSLITTTVVIDKIKYASIKIIPDWKLAFGYYKLQVEIQGRISESLIISAPLKAYGSQANDKKIWGIFVPVYSLHSHNSWGAGDLSDFEYLLEWLSSRGGTLAGTLPLLPSFFDDEFGPGPYMPASRLFWNEFYLDISSIQELDYCQHARELLENPGFQADINKLKLKKHIDYTSQLSLKRKILMPLSQHFFGTSSDRLSEFYEYMLKHSELDKYATFRATGETQGIDWHKWPQYITQQNLDPSGYLNTVKQYYLYTNWLVEKQLQQLSQTAQENNILLYMDLPVGVHPLSYDIWNSPADFVSEVDTGAPPDPVFTSGQNWHFPPNHPSVIRQHQYRYFIDIIRHQLKYAQILRIDHIMGFHRLFWIPKGMENHQGVYVNYPAEEYYAILALESFRHKTVIIGEDLGLVPPEVRQMMNKHNVFRMFIGQYQLISENKLGTIPANSIAGLNTHDMFPFKAFWEENDITERYKLGIINETTAQEELVQRRFMKMTLINILQKFTPDLDETPNPETVFRAVIKLLADSQAYAMLINLEDLWGETGPQNIPGIQNSINWTQKAGYSIEDFTQMNDLIDILKTIDKIRRGLN